MTHARFLCPVFFLLLSATSSAGQAYDFFVKEAPTQCWLDIKEVVHRGSTKVSEDEQHWLLYVGDHSEDVKRVIQIVAEAHHKHGKTEDGCRVYVAVESEGRALDGFTVSNMAAGRLLAAEIESIKKAREKKAKRTKP